LFFFLKLKIHHWLCQHFWYCLFIKTVVNITQKTHSKWIRTTTTTTTYNSCPLTVGVDLPPPTSLLSYILASPLSVIRFNWVSLPDSWVVAGGRVDNLNNRHASAEESKTCISTVRQICTGLYLIISIIINYCMINNICNPNLKQIKTP